MNQSNPPAAAGRYGHYAGIVSRAIALIVDLLILTVILAILTATGQFVSNALSMGQAGQTLIAVVILLLQAVIYVGYYVGFLTLAGQTPGKYMMGLRVITTEGGPVTVRRALVRLTGTVVSLPLFWGYWICLFDDRRQDFPDKLARTFVIYSWPVPEDIQVSKPFKERMARARHERQEQAETQTPAH